MDKEFYIYPLDALVTVRNHLQVLYAICNNEENVSKELDIIENALKDYEELQIKVANDIVGHWVEQDIKEHKALEIIKETQVNIFTVIHSKNYEDFRKKCFDVNCLYLRFPTQEEYDLLKEVL